MFRLGYRFFFVVACVFALSWSMGACSGGGSDSDGSTTQDGGNNSNPDTSTGNSNNTPPDQRNNSGDQTSSGNWPPPNGMAAMEFVVDDSANKSYGPGELLWNGSFVYNKDDNTVTFSAAWQPTDGPFPPLYDDGPIDQGGHEPVGSKAGDHIWGIVVFVKPDDTQDLEFEYGLINTSNHWLWEGPNGLVTVKKGSTDVMKAKGQTLQPHGNIDIKVTLDLSKLQEDFAIDDIKNPPLLFIKGTMTNWAHVQVQDRGQRGDDKEGDGIVTFVQSKNLDYSKHFGLLQHEREVQFVYQFNSMTGREYKDVDDNALPNGVQAWADCNGDGEFTEDEKQTIVMKKDSRGAVQNTAVIVCEGKEPPCSKADCSKERCKDKPICKGCSGDSDCGQDQTCNTATGQCEAKQGGCTKNDCGEDRCKNDPVCKCQSNGDCKVGETCNTTTGQCEATKKCTSDSDCGQDETCNVQSGQCLQKGCTSNDCSLDRCKSDPICTADGPVIYFVTPGVGPVGGGTTIAISGDRFKAGAKVMFGSTAATNVKVDSATKITCDTPAGTGTVDVTVTNTDGKSGTYPQAFKYGGGGPNPGQASVDWCNIQWPKMIPDTNNNIPDAQVGQPSPIIYGWVFKTGVTDKPGQGPGIKAEVGIGPVGSNPATNKDWKWWPATYLGDKAGIGNPTANDEYQGTVTPAKAGTYNYAYRFTGDGTNWWYCTTAGNDKNTPYDPAKATSLTAR